MIEGEHLRCKDCESRAAFVLFLRGCDVQLCRDCHLQFAEKLKRIEQGNDL